MPKTPVIDGGHGVLTDHSISARRRDGSKELIAFLGADDARARGLAYAEFGDARASGYLLRAKPVDAEVRLRLAASEGDAGRAATQYELVLREKPAQTVALVNLGSLYARAGRVAEAARLWERALEANPGIEEAALNLARISKPEKAKVVLQRYLEFNPGSTAARKAINSL